MPRDLTAATPDPDREDTPPMDRPIPTPNQSDPRTRSGTDSRLDSGTDSDSEQEEVSNVIPLPRTSADRGQNPGAELVPETEILDAELVDEDTEAGPDPATAGSEALSARSGRVDTPAERDDRPTSVVLRERFDNRPALLPDWAKSVTEFRHQTVFMARYTAHTTTFHLLRVPAYLARLIGKSPRGFKRVCVHGHAWVFDTEAAPVRKEAVRALDTQAYRQLRLSRKETVRKRLAVAGAALAGASILGFLVSLGPWWMETIACLITLSGLGLLGRQPDQPILSRAVVKTGVQKLTSDIVIRALGGLGISGINQALTAKGAGIHFPAPIVRDGPGWRATIDLPHGVTATEVTERREKFASGLRRPLGCVWPEGDREVHEGRLVLWVGDRDVNKTAQPAWPLDKGGAVDLFKAQPFATDQRGRWVFITLMYISGIIGAIPRMGKTVTLRLWLLIASLDPRAQLHVYDLKGTGDLDPLESVAHAFRAGDEPDDLDYALADMKALAKEFRRRAKVIRGLPADVCPDKRVTSELASKKSLGLQPIVIGVDECQVWFEDAERGKDFEDICTDLVKRGPAVGITLLLATQRPDVKSIPSGISANASTRFCLKVGGQTENDMVLGTSKYKQGVRATTFAWEDKGIGYYLGEGSDAILARSVYKDGPKSLAVIAKARALRERAGTLSGHAAGQNPEVAKQPKYSLVEDVAAVLPAGDKAWSETIVDRLADLRPDVYGEWAKSDGRGKANTLAAALKPFGITTMQVHGQLPDGKPANRRGIVRADVLEALSVVRRDRPGTDDTSTD